MSGGSAREPTSLSNNRTECHPFTNNTVIDTITVGTGPQGVAVASAGPDAGDIFVTNGVSNTSSTLAP